MTTAQEVTNTRDRCLAAYALTLGEPVEVQLLTTGAGYVEGIVTGATDGVLILAVGPARRTVRVPWHAIGTIRNPPTPHPATT